MPSKLALERSFVFDTSAHLAFPTAVTWRYLLAAIDSGTNPARSPRGGGAHSEGLAGPVRPGAGSGPEQPSDGLDEPIRPGWPPRTLRIDHRLWLVCEQRASHLPDVFQTVGTGEQRTVTKQHVVDQPDVGGERMRSGHSPQR